MKKSSEYKLKILYILKFLMEESDENEPLSTPAIIRKLENVGITAERKSIYDDIAALQRFGISIETKREGGRSGYYISERQFELPELKLLVDAVQSSKFITKQKSASLIKKLASLVSHKDAEALNRQVYVSNRIKTMNESIYYIVDMIHSAINDDIQITFKYFNWTPEKKKEYKHDGKIYHVSPFALCWDDENYYMIAHDEDEKIIKHFRVDKLANLSFTDIARNGKEHFKSFDMAQYSKKTFGMFGGAEDTVTLRCHNTMAGAIIDRFGSEVSIFPHGEYFDAPVKVMISRNFFSWVLQFNGKIAITAPDNVKAKMIEFIDTAKETYK